MPINLHHNTYKISSFERSFILNNTFYHHFVENFRITIHISLILKNEDNVIPDIFFSSIYIKLNLNFCSIYIYVLSSCEYFQYTFLCIIVINKKSSNPMNSFFPTIYNYCNPLNFKWLMKLHWIVIIIV